MLRYYLLAVLTQTAIAAYAPYTQIVLRNKGYSYSLTGVIIAVGQAAAIVGPLVMSAFSDRAGKTKKFIVLSAFSALVFAFPFFLSGSEPVVILSIFFLDIFFWSLNPLCDGFLSRAIRGKKTNYGTLRASGTFGYMTALTLFALTSFPDESSNPSILLSFSIFVALFLIAALLQKDEVRERRGGRKVFFSPSWFTPGFYIFMFIVALTRIGQAVVEKLLASYMTETLGLGRYFSLFIAIGALFEFGSMILFGRLLKKKKVTPAFLLFLSAAGLTVRLLLYVIPSIWVFAAAQTLHGLTFGALHVAATTYASESVSSEHYEVAMSIYWALATNLPELIGSLCGGFVIDAFGYPVLFMSYSLFPLIAAVLCVVLRKRISGGKR